MGRFEKEKMKNALKIIRIIFQFICFILLRIIYEPINRILVNIYGCGCKEGFNCNNINNVVVFVLFAISLVIAILNIKIYGTKKLGIICLIVSTIINIFLFPFIWATLMWK